MPSSGRTGWHCWRLPSPDGDDLRWEVTGADAPDFRIVDTEDIASDGKDRVELHFMGQPNFENGKGSESSAELMVPPMIFTG